jgi:hypothetical protein
LSVLRAKIENQQSVAMNILHHAINFRLIRLTGGATSLRYRTG